MEGFPRLPGYTFTDPTRTRFYLPHNLNYVNGYQIPSRPTTEGGSIDMALRFRETLKPLRFDPTLTYGRVQRYPYPQFIPLFAKYRGKCLCFHSFFKQSVHESPDETYRVRKVKIIYYLEDDTVAVMEPTVKNAGYLQGQLVRRSKIPKDTGENFYHWKDFNIGYDVAFHCIVYHIVDADVFTKEFLESQGVEVNEPEEMPQDPYTMKRLYREPITVTKTNSIDDKLRRLLEYDKKILRFYALWEDDSEFGETRKFVIHYYLCDDTIEVVEQHSCNDGRDPFPLLLRRMKIPKNWKDVPATHQPICWELTEEDVEQFYSPSDFQVGETVFFYARRFLIYDADLFTRTFYKECMNTELKPRIDVYFDKKVEKIQHPIPPYNGFGGLEDSVQNCLRVTPRPPKRDFLRLIINAGKRLRYTAILNADEPSDVDRRFIISYLLESGEIEITELPKPRSSDSAKIFLSRRTVAKPDQPPNVEEPEIYGPADFYVGAKLTIFARTYIITGADLATYRYMQANPDKFPSHIIDNIRNYVVSQGFLRDEINDEAQQIVKEQTKECTDIAECCAGVQPPSLATPLCVMPP